MRFVYNKPCRAKILKLNEYVWQPRKFIKQSSVNIGTKMTITSHKNQNQNALCTFKTFTVYIVNMKLEIHVQAMAGFRTSAANFGRR